MATNTTTASQPKRAVDFKLYLHGEFVGRAIAETKGEAVTQMANKCYCKNEHGLMAMRTK